MGAERGAGLGGLQQSQARREGQLLLGSVLGDRRGGMNGTGGEPQRGKLRGFLGTVAGEARRTVQRNLGQCAGAPGSGDAVIPGEPGPELAAGEPPFPRGQALPGYSPDFNSDEAVWGWVREEATGNLCLGSKALVQQRVGNFLSGLASRSGEVKGRCRTVLQSRAEALLRDSQPDFGHTPNAHSTLALV